MMQGLVPDPEEHALASGGFDCSGRGDVAPRHSGGGCSQRRPCRACDRGDRSGSWAPAGGGRSSRARRGWGRAGSRRRGSRCRQDDQAAHDVHVLRAAAQGRAGPLPGDREAPDDRDVEARPHRRWCPGCPKNSQRLAEDRSFRAHEATGGGLAAGGGLGGDARRGRPVRDTVREAGTSSSFGCTGLQRRRGPWGSHCCWSPSPRLVAAPELKSGKSQDASPAPSRRERHLRLVPHHHPFADEEARRVKRGALDRGARRGRDSRGHRALGGSDVRWSGCRMVAVPPRRSVRGRCRTRHPGRSEHPLTKPVVVWR